MRMARVCEHAEPATAAAGCHTQCLHQHGCRPCVCTPGQRACTHARLFARSHERPRRNGTPPCVPTRAHASPCAATTPPPRGLHDEEDALSVASPPAPERMRKVSAWARERALALQVRRPHALFGSLRP
jgi:hypothetical protein